MSRIAQVLLPLPLPEAFDYAEPAELTLSVGDQVAAPLGSRLVRGVVSALREAAGGNRALKPVAARLDDPPLPPNTLEFIQWAARYSVDAPGQPLAIALRGLRAPAAPPPPRRFIASGRASTRPTPARVRALAAAQRPNTRAGLARAAGVSASVVKTLIDDGALIPVPLESADHSPGINLPNRAARLNPSQSAAAGAIGVAVQTGNFETLLLDGVTGSGKTEVYLEAAATALAGDDRGQILILLPEIAITQAVIDRVERRFGAAPAQWHSALSPPRRRRTWEAVADGSARIVVGARSALFLPFARLALIVVDEEHDSSYKQEEGFIYQARDFAVARAKIEACPVILVSATPSLETLWNAQTGRYRWLRLADRHGDASLPSIDLLDLREHAPAVGRWLSPPLTQAVAETLARGEQALLFLNRRGYAPLVLCRACGERLKAPDSDSWLVEHRYSGRLVCHLTGFSIPKPALCPHCHAPRSLVSVGPGVERVAEEARELFPQARLAIFSSDTVADAAAARA
ncbi:MAG: primosomal protein N', partial [Caulobacteraceae bacterium]